jgi:DNA modification methylase
VLQSQIPAGSVDLIYMDPPFGSGNDYEVVFKDGVEIRHFKDRWVGGKQGYLDWIEPRLRAAQNVLKDTGSFYLHCDDHLNAHLRILCDDIFGEANFQNQITWRRSNPHNDPKRFGRNADTILYYSMSDERTWNPQYTPYTKEYMDSHWTEEPDGRFSRTYPLDAPRHGAGTPALLYQWKGKLPAPTRTWGIVKAKMEEYERSGRLVYTRTGTPTLKVYSNDMDGVPLQSIWSDIPPLNPADLGRQDYPTQKPPRLLERIITASSNKDDIVLDPVCGCGTSLLAAKALGRRWIGIDISPTACRLVAKRLGVTTNEIIGLPRSMADIKEMVKLDSIEFQNWVCDLLQAVSTTRRGHKPKADANVDGWFMSTIPIQVKGSEGVGYGEVERFAESVRKRGKSEGYIVAFSFSQKAYEEAVRVHRESKIAIDLLEVQEKVTTTEGGNPDIQTYLYSKLTKRSWGEASERGPATPPPLMLPLKSTRKARTKRLSDAFPATPAYEEKEGPK